MRKLWRGVMETIYHAPVRLASMWFGVPKLMLVIDHSKDGEAYVPLFVANPVRERGRHS